LETAELSKLIKTRRSIRLFQDKPVPEALLVQAIEIATWAPNGANKQNWRFFIIIDKKVINAIGDAIEASGEIILSWPEMSNTGLPSFRPLALDTAAALIVVAFSRSINNPMDDAIAKRAKTDPKARQIFEGRQIVNWQVQSTSAAVAYLLLVLHQMGLGSVWMTGSLYAKADIEKVLRLPLDLDVVTLIPVGYPAENPTKSRKPVNEVCEVIK